MFEQISIFKETSAFARGQMLGRLTAAKVRHSVATYARQFASVGIDWASAQHKALQYLPVIEQLDSGLLDEMHGLANGSGRSFEDILTLNCRSEILPPFYFNLDASLSQAAFKANLQAGVPDWDDLKTNQSQTSLPEDLSECTAMCIGGAASADGTAWLAQNWDWIGQQRKAMILVHAVNGQGVVHTTLTEAGILAKIGMNQHGLCVGLNIVRSVKDGSQSGVPIHIVLRHLLGLQSLVQVRNCLNDLSMRWGFSASSNIPAADRFGEIGCFELAPAGWAECRPNAQGAVVHTNHFLCPSLMPDQADMSQYMSSIPRLKTAQSHALKSPLDRHGLEKFLTDETGDYLAVCRRPNPELPPEARVESVAGIVMRANSCQIWIAPGVPSTVAFEEVFTPFGQTTSQPA
jgi:isopenicillin-N N-acyltransferase-like protein